MRRSAFPMFCHALLLAVGLGLSSQAVAAVQVPDDFVNEPVVTGLNQPIGMAALPDGRMLVAEQRTGNIRVVLPGAGTASDPVFTVPDLNIFTGERGLLGIAVDPAWPLRAYVYLIYTRTGDVMRLVRYQVWGDVANPQSDTLLFVQPLYLFDDLADNDGDHNGGRLRFGPDGCLYVSLGDDQDPCAAADSTVLKGQLLRLEVRNLPAVGTGQTVALEDMEPAGNPFPHSGPEAALTWAYGLRNPWNFQIDPVLGSIYLADVGEQHFEEINEVEPGDFLGWPWREGSRSIQRAGCPEPVASGANDFKGPIIAFAHPPATAAIYMGIMYREQLGGTANWPADYQGFYGNVFYGEYYSGWLRRVRRQGGVWNPGAVVPGQPNSADWGTGFFTATDFMMESDGSVLWLGQFDETFAPGTGHISRIRYAPLVDVDAGGPRAGVFAAAPNPFHGGTELSFTLQSEDDVQLDVYDVTGRRVRSLFAGRAAPGVHRRTWDGRNDAGAALAPGVYLARFERSGRSETLRLMRLR